MEGLASTHHFIVPFLVVFVCVCPVGLEVLLLSVPSYPVGPRNQTQAIRLVAAPLLSEPPHLPWQRIVL